MSTYDEDSTDYGAAAAALGIEVNALAYCADTAMVRDLFASLCCGSGLDVRFRSGVMGRVEGASPFGRQVVSAFNEIAAGGGLLPVDRNGNAAPAIWLRALVRVIKAEQARLADLPDRAAEFNTPFGCHLEG